MPAWDERTGTSRMAQRGARFALFVATFALLTVLPTPGRGQESPRTPTKAVYVVTVDGKVHRGAFEGFHEGFLLLRRLSEGGTPEVLKISPRHIRGLFSEAVEAERSRSTTQWLLDEIRGEIGTTASGPARLPEMPPSVRSYMGESVGASGLDEKDFFNRLLLKSRALASELHREEKTVEALEWARALTATPAPDTFVHSDKYRVFLLRLALLLEVGQRRQMVKVLKDVRDAAARTQGPPSLLPRTEARIKHLLEVWSIDLHRLTGGEEEEPADG